MPTTDYAPELVADIIDELRHIDGPCLPILHAIQEKLGYVPAEAVTEIAKALNLSRAEVHGMVSFYKDFRKVPLGRHVVRVCCADSCQAAGGLALLDQVRHHLGIGFGETTPDGAITLQPVFCLGNCALSPALKVDDRIHGRAEPDMVCKLLDTCRAKVTA